METALVRLVDVAVDRFDFAHDSIAALNLVHPVRTHWPRGNPSGQPTP